MKNIKTNQTNYHTTDLIKEQVAYKNYVARFYSFISLLAKSLTHIH